MATRESLEFLLKDSLKQLKLSAMVQEFPAVGRQARSQGTSYEQYLLELTELEHSKRAENRLKKRLREARFPALKTLDSFDLNLAPGLNRQLLRELAQGEYLAKGENVILLGQSGTGKTHLAIALGVEACRLGHRVYFVTVCHLVNQLVEAQEESVVERLLRRLSQYDLLILDELGYVPFSSRGAQLLFQVIGDRHEHKSTLITTNLGFDKWPQVFGDATLTAALLDRVTHRAYMIPCNWESVRLSQSMKKRTGQGALPGRVSKKQNSEAGCQPKQ
jgi:DNA replication protein DnaC